MGEPIGPGPAHGAPKWENQWGQNLAQEHQSGRTNKARASAWSTKVGEPIRSGPAHGAPKMGEPLEPELSAWSTKMGESIGPNPKMEHQGEPMGPNLRMVRQSGISNMGKSGDRDGAPK